MLEVEWYGIVGHFAEFGVGVGYDEIALSGACVGECAYIIGFCQRCHGGEIVDAYIACGNFRLDYFIVDGVERPELDSLHVGTPVVFFVEHESGGAIVSGGVAVDEEVCPVVYVGVHFEAFAFLEHGKVGLCGAGHACREPDFVAGGRELHFFFVCAGCDSERCGCCYRKQLES